MDDASDTLRHRRRGNRRSMAFKTASAVRDFGQHQPS